MFLNTKIPPPIVTILFAIMIFYFSDNFHMSIYLLKYIFQYFLLLGFFVTFSSARNFKKKDTTVNPMKPNETSKLVTDGFFKITRNPMYLGMLLFLLGLSIYNGLIVGLIFLPLFVGYITYFQIIPEENAMLELFGEEFKVYMKKVRRWI